MLHTIAYFAVGVDDGRYLLGGKIVDGYGPQVPRAVCHSLTGRRCSLWLTQPVFHRP